MPMRIGVPPLGLSRRRLSLVDPAYSGSGPPVPTDTFEDDRNPPDPTIGSPEGSSKTDHFSTALKLLAPLLGLMAGGKKGLAYGTQFSTGFIDEQRKIRGEQETARERQSLASDRERRTQAEERRASLAEDKADAETWTWDSQNRVFASNKGNIKQPAQGMVTIPPEEAKGTYDGDRGVIVYQNKGEFKVLKGLPAKQFKPEAEKTSPLPRRAPFIVKDGQKLGWDGTNYTLPMGSVEDTKKESEIKDTLKTDTDPADTTKTPPRPLAPGMAPTDTTGGRPSMASRPTGAPTVRPEGTALVEDAARIKRLMGKINPDTGQNFTESEAIAFIAKNK